MGSEQLFWVCKTERDHERNNRAFRLWLSTLPTRSRIVEKGNGEVEVVRNPKGKQRSMEVINRPVELLWVMLNYAVDEWIISPEQNPFFHKSAKTLIERAAEVSRERFLTFGEELALINYCDRPGPRGNVHLRAALIVAADTGLRENELFTLEKKDVDFKSDVINVRAINAKTNRPRPISMTRSVKEEILRLCESAPGNLIFGGLKEVRGSFNTPAGRSRFLIYTSTISGTPSYRDPSWIMAGIPPAVALKASGHASDEWKRYLNMTPGQLQNLFKPLDSTLSNYAAADMQESKCCQSFIDKLMKSTF